MRLHDAPEWASWIHRDARTGVEVVFFSVGESGSRLRGSSAADGPSGPSAVGYDIDVDSQWVTRSVRAQNINAGGAQQVLVVRDDDGVWTVDGIVRPDLSGCDDIDLESSAVTNTLPVHRLDLRVGVAVEVPAAFVRAVDLGVERIEQRYELIAADGDGLRVAYESSTFDFSCELRFDRAGLILDYPGIAVRSTTRSQRARLMTSSKARSTSA